MGKHSLIILATALTFGTACTKKKKKDDAKEEVVILNGVNEDYVAFNFEDLDNMSKGEKLSYKVHFKKSHAFGDVRMLESAGYAPLKKLKEKFPGEKGNIRLALYKGDTLIAEAAHEGVDFSSPEMIKIVLKGCQILKPWDGSGHRGGCQYDINSK